MKLRLIGRKFYPTLVTLVKSLKPLPLLRLSNSLKKTITLDQLPTTDLISLSVVTVLAGPSLAIKKLEVARSSWKLNGTATKCPPQSTTRATYGQISLWSTRESTLGKECQSRKRLSPLTLVLMKTKKRTRLWNRDLPNTRLRSLQRRDSFKLLSTQRSSYLESATIKLRRKLIVLLARARLRSRWRDIERI